MRTPLVIGNWKMNTTRASAEALAASIAADAPAGVELGVAPPSVYLPAVLASAGSNVGVFAQDVSAHDDGAYTGELSAGMLADIGAAGALVGHSERRAYHGETDSDVRAKIDRLDDAGLHAVLCVGETLEERDAGHTWDVVRDQLQGALSGRTSLSRVTIAYEPVWAIGTGRTATPEQAEEVHAAIRAWLDEQFGDAAKGVRVLYGGSMKPGNAGELIAQASIDGGLVGGASLDAASFLAIARAALG